MTICARHNGQYTNVACHTRFTPNVRERNLSIVRWSDICHIDFWEKWHCFWKCFLAKGLSVVHLSYYIVYIAR